MIRKLTANDSADFQSWALAIPQTTFFNWSLQSLTDSFQKNICWGLWHEQKLSSVLCFLNLSDPLEILWLATHPEMESRGHMKKLLKELLLSFPDSAMRQEALVGREVILEVHEKNLKAIKLYTSLGFTEFGRRKNYYQDGSSALVMGLKPQ